MKTIQLALRLTKQIHAAVHDHANANRKTAGAWISDVIINATPDDVVAAFADRVKKNGVVAPYDKKTLALAAPAAVDKLETLAAVTGLSKDAVLRLILERFTQIPTLTTYRNTA
jgi:hypothetical protein